MQQRSRCDALLIERPLTLMTWAYVLAIQETHGQQTTFQSSNSVGLRPIAKIPADQGANFAVTTFDPHRCHQTAGAEEHAHAIPLVGERDARWHGYVTPMGWSSTSVTDP